MNSLFNDQYIAFSDREMIQNLERNTWSLTEENDNNIYENMEHEINDCNTQDDNDIHYTSEGV